jgi:hypothetical protein
MITYQKATTYKNTQKKLKKPTLNLLIEKKIELLPRSLKLRLCSSRLKKKLNFSEVDSPKYPWPRKMHIPWYDLYFHEFWNFFSKTITTHDLTTHTNTKYFSIHEKKIRKHRSVIAHILYPCTTFCLTNQTKKKKKNTHVIIYHCMII